MQRNIYRLPRMEEYILFSRDVKRFSSAIANRGYWKIKGKKRDHLATAFTSHHNFQQFVTMPFGSKNAAATFQRIMDVMTSIAK